MANMVKQARFIGRDFVRGNRDVIFLFADNLARKGFTGQAREMRGEPNAIGIPTKYYPGRSEDSYFADRDFEIAKVHIDAAFDSIPDGASVMVPSSGIGGGQSELMTRAPKIYEYIQNRIMNLEQ